MEFGTGCLKITPAHDINDYEIGMRHNLESIDILNDDGTLSEKAGLFVGEDRFVVRNKIITSLEEAGNHRCSHRAQAEHPMVLTHGRAGQTGAGSCDE